MSASVSGLLISIMGTSRKGKYKSKIIVFRVGLALAIALGCGRVCAAMACANGVGGNLSRLPCGGDL